MARQLQTKFLSQLLPYAAATNQHAAPSAMAVAHLHPKAAKRCGGSGINNLD